MAERIVPTPEQLRELLIYEPETGKLFWKERPLHFCSSEKEMNRWNSRHSGTEALTSVNNSGYFAGNILSRPLLAHRVAWAIATGHWPKNEIDHINCKRLDNRISNLREATLLENARNKKKRAGTSLKLKGVSLSKSGKKFEARIWNEGRLLHIGSYESEADAHSAYCAAAHKYHGEFARTE